MKSRKSRCRNGWSRITRHGLEQNGQGLNARRSALLGHQKPVVCVGYHQGAQMRFW
jgi:hypothetical protein